VATARSFLPQVVAIVPCVLTFVVKVPAYLRARLYLLMSDQLVIFRPGFRQHVYFDPFFQIALLPSSTYLCVFSFPDPFQWSKTPDNFPQCSVTVPGIFRSTEPVHSTKEFYGLSIFPEVLPLCRLTTVLLVRIQNLDIVFFMCKVPMCSGFYPLYCILDFLLPRIFPNGTFPLNCLF